MCGIIGYLGSDLYKEYLISGLKLLQNRGYDSVGISCVSNGELNTIKFASKTTYDALAVLEDEVIKNPIISSCAIGHTRWATHGGKTDVNAHPHHDNSNKIALVHNGIIENFDELKQKLLNKGYHFKSQTDTEIIAVLIGYYIDNGQPIENAIQKTVEELVGTWALVIMHAEYPNKLWITRNGSPLLLGMEDEYIMIASEQIAFGNYINKYIVLDNHDLIEITKEDKTIKYNKNIHRYAIKDKILTNAETTPLNYKHWMLKEIMEQPDCIIRAMNNGGRIENNVCVKLGGLDLYQRSFETAPRRGAIVQTVTGNLVEVSSAERTEIFNGVNKSRLLNINHLIILGCGTSYHAGLWSLDIFKTLDIFDTVVSYDGAEFQIKDIPKKGTIGVILLSQSGETKDLHRCIQIAKDYDLITIGVVNVPDSLIARETDCGVYLNAGREVAVASTKSFTSQCVVLSMVAIWFSQHRGTCIERRKQIINDLRNLPFQIQNVLDNNENLMQYTNKFNKTSCFILGKGKEEAIAKEGALKMKEVTYIHTEGYSSSSLKHGPFALIEDELPIILLDINDENRDKNRNTYQEIKARNAFVLRITDLEGELLIEKNKTFGGLIANVYIQLLSYYLSIEKGFNPDFPRNLAKVVTVE
jgi:glucosamine--fructose-6-phosphate aminotransferase (isomerizing)